MRISEYRLHCVEGWISVPEVQRHVHAQLIKQPIDPALLAKRYKGNSLRARVFTIDGELGGDHFSFKGSTRGLTRALEACQTDIERDAQRDSANVCLDAIPETGV